MFLFKKNDWIQVWNSSAKWVDGNNNIISHVHYMIDYSPSRSKYRLRGEGRNHKEHGFYGEALSMLTQFNLELLNDPQKVRHDKLKKLGI